MVLKSSQRVISLPIFAICLVSSVLKYFCPNTSLPPISSPPQAMSGHGKALFPFTPTRAAGVPGQVPPHAMLSVAQPSSTTQSSAYGKADGSKKDKARSFLSSFHLFSKISSGMQI